MRIPFRSGRKCWAYFSLIILFNAVCLYCGWLSLKTTTVGVKRKKLSSKPLDVAVYLVPRSDTLPNRIPDVPATASWWSGDDVLTSGRANGTPTARPAYRVTRGKTDDPAVLRTRQYFHTRMSAREFRICTDILRRFVELVEPQNLTYFMYGGTLLGSYRHHGIIPWDDDLDIIMKISEKELVRNILSPLSPHYFLNGKQGKRWKFYSSLSRPIPGITWAWPYLDISFFKENKTHIWDSDPLFSRSYVYKKTEIFPLVRRPFMDFMLPAPRDTGAALSKHYSFSICKSNTYDHKREIFVSQFRRRTLPCVLLKDMFPIVSHHSAAKGTNETLEYNGKVVKWFLRKN